MFNLRAVPDSNIVEITSTDHPELKVSVVDSRTTTRVKSLPSGTLVTIMCNILACTDKEYGIASAASYSNTKKDTQVLYSSTSIVDGSDAVPAPITAPQFFKYKGDSSDELGVFEDAYGSVVFCLDLEEEDPESYSVDLKIVEGTFEDLTTILNL